MLRLGTWLKTPGISTRSLAQNHKQRQQYIKISPYFYSGTPTYKNPSPDANLLKPAIYISESDDPYFNLAFEDWIFRRTDPNQIVLYMYRNRPSVIVGRNQNPWKEVNLKELRKLNILFVRRKSGGGTVYHDLGNTNYCVYVPRVNFERRINADLVSRALRDLDIPAYVNERNDICVDKFKVSGSAFKLVNARAYHHGTMLINAKLDHLRGVLGTSKEELLTKGVASFSSPVKNLQEWKSNIGHDEFVDSVAKEFSRTYGGDGVVKTISAEDESDNAYVTGVKNELKSWDWMYGQSPEFTHTIRGNRAGEELECLIHSRHGLITSITLTKASPETRKSTLKLFDVMAGDRYGTLEKATESLISNSGEDQAKSRELIDWLKAEM